MKRSAIFLLFLLVIGVLTTRNYWENPVLPTAPAPSVADAKRLEAVLSPTVSSCIEYAAWLQGNTIVRDFEGKLIDYHFDCAKSTILLPKAMIWVGSNTSVHRPVDYVPR